MQTFTREQVASLLIAAQILSSSNHHQGLEEVIGNTYKEKAEHMIDAFGTRVGNSLLTSVIYYMTHPI